MNLLNRIYEFIAQPERHLRMTLLTLLYVFMTVAVKLTISDRRALNPFYDIFIIVGFVFFVLFIAGILIKWDERRKTLNIMKKYKIMVIR